MHLYAIFLLELIILFFLSRKVTKKLGKFIFKLTKSEKWTVYFMSILFLPGTFIHEISHFLTALILLVPVRQIELLPKVEEGKVVMGRVPIAKVDFVRRTLVGTAPLFVGLGVIFATIFFITSEGFLTNPFYTFLVGYLVFEAGNTMYLSKKDVEGLWVSIVVFGLIFAALYFIGFRISQESFLFGERAMSLVKTANIYLAVPILIDFLLLLVMSFFKGIIGQ
jgi:hypothetical protein